MEEIYKYIENHASVPSEALEWVVKQTHIRTNHARMLSGLTQGQLMRMIVQMTGARRVLELQYAWLQEFRKDGISTPVNSMTNWKTSSLRDSSVPDWLT